MNLRSPLAMARGDSDGHGFADGGPPPRRVTAELEPSAGRIRLHVTEDDTCFAVTACCVDVAAEAFDVQLDMHRVWIGRTDRRADEARLARRDDRRGVGRLLSLFFDHPIDTANSRGECADGWLRLSLRKAGSGRPAPRLRGVNGFAAPRRKNRAGSPPVAAARRRPSPPGRFIECTRSAAAPACSWCSTGWIRTRHG